MIHFFPAFTCFFFFFSFFSLSTVLYLFNSTFSFFYYSLGWWSGVGWSNFYIERGTKIGPGISLLGKVLMQSIFTFSCTVFFATSTLFKSFLKYVQGRRNVRFFLLVYAHSRESGLAELPSPPSWWRWCWVANTQPGRVPEQLMASETYLGVEHISAASPDQMAKIVVVPGNKMLPACRQSSLISDGVNDSGGRPLMGGGGGGSHIWRFSSHFIGRSILPALHFSFSNFTLPFFFLTALSTSHMSCEWCGQKTWPMSAWHHPWWHNLFLMREGITNFYFSFLRVPPFVARGEGVLSLICFSVRCAKGGGGGGIGFFPFSLSLLFAPHSNLSLLSPEQREEEEELLVVFTSVRFRW